MAGAHRTRKKRDKCNLIPMSNYKPAPQRCPFGGRCDIGKGLYDCKTCSKLRDA